MAENRKSFNIAVKNISELSKNLNQIVADSRNSIVKTIAYLEKFSKLLHDESPEIAENANKLIKDLNQVLGENRGQLKASMVNIKHASAKLDKTMDVVNEISQKIAKGEGTVGKLLYTEDTYSNLNETLGGLKNFFKRTGEWKLYVGARSEYLDKTENSKTYATLKLQPQSDKYYLLEIIDDPRGNVTTETIRREIDGKLVEIVEEETIDDKLKFSVEFAKRFQKFTIRGGLIESSGGLGLDYELFDDKLKLSVDAWDLGEDNPHLKFTSKFYLYDQVLFVNAGVDDIVDKEYRSFFFGAGLMFSDDDLKYLLSSLPVSF